MQGESDGEDFSTPSPLSAPPTEDAGARTIGYYEFQFGCVAAFCLQMDRETGPAWVTCEWHTDFIVGWATEFMPVSVKHREADTGRWTIATLFSDGGLRTLFDRWKALGKPRECRWMTNGGLDSDCKNLQRSCSEGGGDALREIADQYAWRFGGGVSNDEVYEFFCAVRFERTNAEASNQRILNIERFARPALTRLGLSLIGAPAAYDEIVSLVRTASSGHPDSVPDIWLTMAAGSLDLSRLTDADVQRRTIHESRVKETLLRVCGPQPVAETPAAPAGTTLAKKLEKGALVSTAQASASRTRMHWTAFEASWSEPLPSVSGDSEIERLRVMLVNRAAAIQIESAQKGEPYGNSMYMGMREEARKLVDETGFSGLTDDLVMGLVYDLTASCEIWWSPMFDLEADEALKAVQE